MKKLVFTATLLISVGLPQLAEATESRCRTIHSEQSNMPILICDQGEDERIVLPSDSLPDAVPMRKMQKSKGSQKQALGKRHQGILAKEHPSHAELAELVEAYSKFVNKSAPKAQAKAAAARAIRASEPARDYQEAGRAPAVDRASVAPYLNERNQVVRGHEPVVGGPHHLRGDNGHNRAVGAE